MLLVNPALLLMTTCWLVVSGVSAGPLWFEAPAPSGLQEGALSLLWRDGRVLGKVVRHGARVHGVIVGGSVSGPVEVRLAAGLAAAVGCELSASGLQMGGLRMDRTGYMERGVLRLEPIPACNGADEMRDVHSCAVATECAGGGLALDGALALQWSLRSDVAGTLHWFLRAEALRPVMLPDGLGLGCEGAAWPFASTAERLSRGAKGWRADGSVESVDAWPLALGDAGFLAPPSPWQLWFEHAERQDSGGFRLLVLPRGARLEAGESRIFRTLLSQHALDPAAKAMLLAAEPTAPSTPFDQLVRSQVQRFLDDGVHGLRRREPDAGDWMHQSNAVGNLEYDTIGGLLAHGIKWGDARAISAGLAARDHLLSVDLAPSRGFPFEHGAGHRSGQHEAGHHWMWGLLSARRAWPDPLIDPVLERLLVQQECEFESFDPRRELERSTGWGLLALSETGAAAALSKRGVRSLTRLARQFTSRPWSAGWIAPVISAAKDRTLILDSFEQGIHLLALSALARSDLCEAARERAGRLAMRLNEDALHPDAEGKLHLVESIAVERGAGRTVHVTGTQRAAKALLVLAAMRQVIGKRSCARISAAEETALARFATEARKFTGEETALLLFAERLRDAGPLNRRGG